MTYKISPIDNSRLKIIRIDNRSTYYRKFKKLYGLSAIESLRLVYGLI